MRIVAQLQEIIIFTCNPIKNEDTNHELPKDMNNPKQDRKFGSLRFAAFLASLLCNTFAK